MRLVDAVFMLLFFGVFGRIYASTFIKTLGNAETKIKFEKKADSYEFISESFRAACDGYGFPSLEDWESTVKVMWKLDDVKIENKDNLYHLVWSGPDGGGEIFHGEKRNGHKTQRDGF